MHMINDKGEAVYFNYVRKNNKGEHQHERITH